MTLDEKVAQCKETRKYSTTFKGEQYCGLLTPYNYNKCEYTGKNEQKENMNICKCNYKR